MCVHDDGVVMEGELCVYGVEIEIVDGLGLGLVCYLHLFVLG